MNQLDLTTIDYELLQRQLDEVKKAKAKEEKAKAKEEKAKAAEEASALKAKAREEKAKAAEEASALKAKAREEKRKAIEEASALKAKIRDEELEGLSVYFEEYIKQKDIYYVAQNDLYCLYNKELGTWTYIKPRALSEMEPDLRDAEAKVLFTNILKANNRIFMNTELTFRETHSDTLNLLRIDHWLKPIDGEHNIAFDILLRSLGDGKQENIDHIEHVLWYKYKNPSDFQLPCLVIYGQGGVGKDLFVDAVCRNIFGKHFATSVSADDLSGFNDLIMGKAIVYINESGYDKADMDTLKRIIGSPTLQVNIKFGPKLTADNTPLYFMGTNDPLAAVQLADDGSDRRWSILRTDRTLLEHINDVLGLGIEYDHPKELQSNKLLMKLSDDLIDNYLRNETEVAKFLNYLREKWEDKGRPRALQGEDYKELLSRQRKTDACLFDEIFKDEDFVFITLADLYDEYKKRIVDDSVKSNPAGLNKINFREKAKQWLAKYAKHIEFYDKANISLEGKPSTASGFGLKAFKGRYPVKRPIRSIINEYQRNAGQSRRPQNDGIYH